MAISWDVYKNRICWIIQISILTVYGVTILVPSNSGGWICVSFTLEGYVITICYISIYRLMYKDWLLCKLQNCNNGWEKGTLSSHDINGNVTFHDKMWNYIKWQNELVPCHRKRDIVMVKWVCCHDKMSLNFITGKEILHCHGKVNICVVMAKGPMPPHGKGDMYLAIPKGTYNLWQMGH